MRLGMSVFKKISLNGLFWGLAGVMFTVFVVDAGLGIHKTCTSNARDAIIEAIKRDATIAGHLGELEQAGCVFGMIYEDPDYAIGTIWMTLEGALDEGMLYARFMKSQGNWWLTSARMDLGNAGSFFIDGRRPDKSTETTGSLLRVDTMRENDHPLMADRSSAGRWNETGWPEQHLRFEVPGDWRVAQKAHDELQLYSSTSDLYLIVRITPDSDAYRSMRFMREKKRKENSWWNRGRARPSVFSTIGNLRGYIEWPARDERMIQWQGYRDHPELGTDRVSFLFGASTSELFEKNRPLFGAILASIDSHD
jgi:hypothetical protein